MGSSKIDLGNYYPIGIVIFAFLLFFPGLGARDLWAPVEPRYAEIARIMFAKSQWIVPTINGDLYTDKPMLFFWIVLLASKIFGGVSEWTVRFPAAIGGIGFVLTTFYLGRDFFSPRVGALSAIVVATSFRVLWESRWAHIDMLFGCFFLLSIYLGARTLLRRGGPNEILLAYVFMALATLAKGLIGIVLPALLFILLMVVRRDWSMIKAARMELGIPLFLLVAAPWFYLVNHATDGKWLSDFIYIHHIRRYTAGAGHRQPFYYYFTTLPVDFLPWTAFSIPALIARRDYRSAWAEPHLQFFLLWFLTVFIFFTISDTKRDLYLLPLFPTLAIFVANYLDDLESRLISWSAVLTWLTGMFFTLVALAGFMLPIGAWVARPAAFWPIFPSSVVLAVGAGVTFSLLRRRRSLAAAVSVSAMMMLAIIAAALWLFPYLEQFKSHRQFSSEIKRIVPATAPLYVYADSMNDFNFYTQREEIPVLSTAAQIETLRTGREKSYLLAKERDLRRLPELPRAWFITSRLVGSTKWNLLEISSRPTN